ncbi:jg17578 [Pararge aegeria aegeria]|uniref:Jg17578 protein n=1 Tax=Pararge aegeria aegeria TaxID=348720 RepID=A0A8S4RR48_9NEOP|nr:jg17578 [Pararge aegeria aegeria]
MWCWRRMLRIPWNAFQTNKAILEELGITQRLSSIVQARILTFFGHVSRRDNDSIERLVVQGRIEGTRSRGRSPMRWADRIKAAVAVPLHECARKAAARGLAMNSQARHNPEMTTTTALTRANRLRRRYVIYSTLLDL